MEALELWPSLIGVHQYDEADAINPLFHRIFMAMRATDPDYFGNETFYASRDDLLHRVKIPEWNNFLEFSASAVRDTAKKANQGVWPNESVDLQIEINGIWFQISNHGAHHDIHTHGNCSWSAVYIVDVDLADQQINNVGRNALNGITRFYSPLFERLGGAYMDFGNAYLQNATVDFDPIPGRLLVFPSWLPHQAMPYTGQRDRIIISFNASVHRRGMTDAIAGFAAS
jgi:hypothetical protein